MKFCLQTSLWAGTHQPSPVPSPLLDPRVLSRCYYPHQAVMVHTFNLKTREAEAGASLSFRPAYSTEQVSGQTELHREPCLGEGSAILLASLWAEVKRLLLKTEEGTADLHEETFVYHSPTCQYSVACQYHTVCRTPQYTLLGGSFLPSTEVSVVLKQGCLGFSGCHRGIGRAQKARDAGKQHEWHQMTPQGGILWPKFLTTPKLRNSENVTHHQKYLYKQCTEVWGGGVGSTEEISLSFTTVWVPRKITEQMPTRWFRRLKGLPPSLRTWVRSPGPTEWEETTEARCPLTPTSTVIMYHICAHLCAHIHIHTHLNEATTILN